MADSDLLRAKLLQATTKAYTESFANRLLNGSLGSSTLADTSNIQRGMLRLSVTEVTEQRDKSSASPKPTGAA